MLFHVLNHHLQSARFLLRFYNRILFQEWIDAPVKPGLSVFTVGKRIGTFHNWEPIYVGTARDPPYDERLSWEGKSDKMTQVSQRPVLMKTS